MGEETQQAVRSEFRQQTIPALLEAYNRPPRIWSTPSLEKVPVPSPVAQEVLPDLPGFTTLLLPLIMMSMLLGISVAFSHGSTAQLAFLLPMALFSLITPLSTILRVHQSRKKVLRRRLQNEEAYKKVLEELRIMLTKHIEEQRYMSLITDPDLRELEERIGRRFHLWERRPEDPDFLSVRIGRGRQPFSMELQFPTLEITHPLVEYITQMKADFSSVRDIPCSLSLPKVKSLGITGRRQDVAIFAHGLLCQIATHHSPQDVRLMGLYPHSQQHDWEWLRLLPHTLPLKSGKGIQERLLASGQEEADQLLNVLLEELSVRASKSNEEDQGEVPLNLPHIVVVVHDYVEVRKHPALANAFKLGDQLGVSIIYLVAQEEAIPGECRGVLRIARDEEEKNALAQIVGGTQSGVSVVEELPARNSVTVNYAGVGYNGDRIEEAREELLDLGLVHSIAQALARVQFAEEGENIVNLPTNVRFIDLVDLHYTDQLDVARWWNASPPFGTLRVPIGGGVNGTVWIDFNETVHGPHGIIAGTTGSGKSELLQSMLAGLAITHHPYLVNFVLVDFKGGATFKPFEKIPHTVGMVTDLSGRLTERALVALKSELKRREHILNQADAKNITQYQSLRAIRLAAKGTLETIAEEARQLLAKQEREVPSAPSLEPLPHLFIVIDEFAELAKEHPAFMEGLVSVVQKGRSLGVHLILATQKPTGVVNANIWSNLKFRICLRVASLQDSRDMLGRSEAALLPSTIPGRAYFQISTEVFELFQSARTSLPARMSSEQSLAERGTRGYEGLTDLQVLMESLEPYKETLGKELFRPWPDPLPHQISLEEVYEHPLAKLARSVGQSPLYGWLVCPLGLIDLPMDQRQLPFLLDLPHQGGHMLVAGAPGSGKSTFLRTMISSLVRTHLPSQVHIYIVDFGGQMLRVFERLPHIGGVFGEADEEHTRRLIRKLQGVIEERKQLFGTHQVDDFLGYQRRLLSSLSELPALPALVLVINRFSEFRQVHEKEMERFLAVARYGRTYGVHIVLTIDRPTAIPAQLLSLIETRLSFRLVEATDSLILLGKTDAARLDSTTPGRGYLRGKVLQEVQIALPLAYENDDDQTQQLEEMVSELLSQVHTYQEEKPGQQQLEVAPPIRLLPGHLLYDELVHEIERQEMTTSHVAQVQKGLHLYLGLEDLSLQPFALEFGVDAPHALVAGGPGSGRTNVLHTLLLMLERGFVAQRAKVVLVDFRRTSRLLRRLSTVWQYADTEERLVEVVSTLITELQLRAKQLHEALEQNSLADEPIELDVPPIVLIIDDYDQLSILMKNPLNDLKSLMLQARDLRFHVIVAGAPGDLGRSDALLQQVRAWRLGIILNADPAEPALLGVRMSDLPTGRAYLVRRNQRYLIQVAHTEARGTRVRTESPSLSKKS